MQSHFITDVFHNMRFAKTAAGLHIPCNALITISMVYNLVRNRNDIKRTNTALNLLSFYAINCGALNLVFSVICFAFHSALCAFLHPNNWDILFFLHGKPQLKASRPPNFGKLRRRGPAFPSYS
ncbi:hypothetical protein B0F90DRAFT_890175 [Multifurca ochricompacta]|uniref:DUF6534 domain-containing protein n=1 Tax=Multifurca ochricompacta TaxID=376703 RepID=A0AAD4QJ78_9AGAM|nr:hypothetical protein B0F90DRAFT_890175 [Multifurca ochricompacta]